jgi:hypothetical protein
LLLEKNPLPKLGSIEYLDQTTVDLGAPYSELDSEFACEDNPLETKSKSKSGRKTKSNHKSKSTKRKKRRVEVDDSRPESDQNLFERIQATKYLARLAGRKPLSALHPTDMATGTRNRRANDDPNEEYLGQSQPREQGSLSLANMTPEDRKIFDEELEKILLCDKKLSKDARSDALKKCRRYHLIMNYNITALYKHKAENEMLQSKCKQLEAQVNASKQKAEARISKGKAQLLRINEDEKKRIDALVTSELWRTCKFINDKEDEEEASEFIYNIIYGKQSTNKDKMYSWTATYKAHIKKALYARRNYSTSQIKLAANDLFKNNEPVPTVEQILKCISRTIDVNDEQEMAVFQWYWEVLLPKMVGAAEWGNNVRYYTTIYAAKIPGDEQNRKLVHYSHEGMILAIWDNNIEKWRELYDWSLSPANQGKKQKNSGGKYTSTTKGQRQYGGWEPSGIEAYNRYCEEAKAGRSLANRKILERRTLDLLREKYNINQPDHDSQARAIRSRKRKKDAPDQQIQPMARIVKTKMLDEEVYSEEEDSDLS